MLIPHKFGANASNLVLMHKKTDGGCHYNFFFFFFFLNHVLHKTVRTPGKPTGRTPSIFQNKLGGNFNLLTNTKFEIIFCIVFHYSIIFK
jgi:hypothetical protein